MDDAKKWLKRARSSLILSKTQKTDEIFYEDLCFDAQQASEKSLKGLLIHLGIKPPKTHSFRQILLEIEKHLSIPDEILKVLDLDDYSVFTRYPGDYAPILESEYKDAVAITEAVYSWVEQQLNN